MALRKEKLIYLTTTGRRTGRPHTVEIWFAYADGRIFLSHEGKHTDWMKNIRHKARVHARIGPLDFEARAAVVKESKDLELGKTSLYEKYYGPATRAKIDDWFELSTILELAPTSPMDPHPKSAI